MHCKKINKAFLWLKRKVTIVMAAVMIGISNVIYEEEKMIHGDFIKTEQKQEKDSD
ncbi:hypothetical protein Q2T41_07455 [Maribacter confluentis]|uniref:Uncharacterized protein n=1 Tax=Maribacter confluentis TaxID=1656093 RepID=A0ABT8RNM5_9FLAO|nr:hypothetical protein [Maribacter confluentis]MDO1512486.1 hypothetical protein [Maribacter confluentis]